MFLEGGGACLALEVSPKDSLPCSPIEAPKVRTFRVSCLALSRGTRRL